MNRVIGVTLFLSKTFIKEKIFSLFLLISLLTILIPIELSGVSIGDKEEKLFFDATLTLQSFTLHLVAIFSIMLYLDKEKRGGLFIFPLSSGINREEYFLSLTLSRFFIILLLAIVFGVINFVYIYLFNIDEKLNFHLLLLTTSSTLLSLIFLTFAQYTTQLRAMIYALIIYFLGNGLDELYIYSYQLENNTQLQIVYDITSKLIPNFYIFEQDSISIFNIGHITIEFIIIYILGVVKFKSKILKVEN